MDLPVDADAGSAEPVRVHIGDILCGNKVIADQEQLTILTELWPKAVAVEMESSGIAAALLQSKHPPHFIVVKGVSDDATKAKADTPWRSYAAKAPAAFTLALIDHSS